MTDLQPIGGRVLDVAALLDLAENRTIYGQSLLTTALERGVILAAPAAALAAARAQLGPDGRARLHLLPDLWVVVVATLTLDAAEVAGDLLATADDASLDDVAAAHAVLVALRRGWPIVSDRGETLRAIAGTIEIEQLP